MSFFKNEFDYYQMAKSKEMEGNYQNAIKLYKKCIRIKRGNPLVKYDAYTDLAYLYERMGDYDAALQIWINCQDNADPIPYVQIGVLYHKLQCPTFSNNFFKKAVEVGGDEIRNHINSLGYDVLYDT